jgi:hypothetical protein
VGSAPFGCATVARDAVTVRDLLVVAAGAPYRGIPHPVTEVVAFGLGR